MTGLAAKAPVRRAVGRLAALYAAERSGVLSRAASRRISRAISSATRSLVTDDGRVDLARLHRRAESATRSEFRRQSGA